jgi:hypothetical protein
MIRIETDGSMQADNRCSFGWCLKLLRTQETIRDVTAICSGPVNGDTKANSSTREELFGIASSLFFLTLAIEFYQIDTDSEVRRLRLIESMAIHFGISQS